jgi:hypothetical protein
VDRRRDRLASTCRSGSRSTSRRASRELPVVGQAAVLGALHMLANAMGPQGVAPFIYYRF